MHARQLAELGGWLAICSKALKNSPASDVPDGMKYWAASKCRIQRWQSALKVFENDLKNPQPMHDPWPAISVVIQEILISDLLTRIWTAALSQNSTEFQNHELLSVGHSIYIGHLEIRNRALQLLLEYRSSNEKRVEELDELRRRIERWTDMLLSRMQQLDSAQRFGFDEKRIQDFAIDRNLESRHRRKEVEQILMASLTTSLQGGWKPAFSQSRFE